MPYSVLNVGKVQSEYNPHILILPLSLTSWPSQAVRDGREGGAGWWRGGATELLVYPGLYLHHALAPALARHALQVQIPVPLPPGLLDTEHNTGSAQTSAIRRS